MAAIDSTSATPLLARASGELVRRTNWAAKNVGPMVVFCIVGAIAIFLIILFIIKKRQARMQAA